MAKVRWDAPLVTVDDLEELRSSALDVVDDDPEWAGRLHRAADEIERLWRLVGQ